MRRATWIGLVGPLLAACQLEQQLNPMVGTEEVLTSVVQFVDLPVPKELQVLSGVQQSWSYQRGKFRNANLEYEGSIHLNDVRAFLRERLPKHGWTLLEEERPAEERIVQRWLSEAEPGVQYRLRAELRKTGPKSHLNYHLWTRRASHSAAVDAATPKK